jgi:hypothetical protein
MKTTFIYYLEKNNTPIYIGKSNCPKQRMSTNHYKNFGGDIKQYIIDEVPRNEWRFWEQFYIDLFRSWNCNLKQQKKGGGGLCHHTKTTIEKIKQAQMNRDYSYLTNPERGKKISEATKGKKKTGDLSHLRDLKRIEKIKQARTGKPHPKKSNHVLQFDLEGKFIKEWTSAEEAAHELKLSSDRIRATCLEKQNKSGNFIWKYKK